MLYYKVLVKFNAKKNEEADLPEACDEEFEWNNRSELSAHVKSVFEEFNEKNEGCICFASSVTRKGATVNMISAERMDPVKMAKHFVAAMGFTVKEASAEEITFNTLQSNLRQANRQDFIEDDDEVLAQFDLGPLGRSFRFGENLVPEKSDPLVLQEKAREYYAQETLLPELDRILAGKKAVRAKGHPVHYLLEFDDRIARREICRTLLNALYAGRRLVNRRYAFVDFHPGENYSRVGFETLYKSCEGGAVVVRYMGDDGTDEEQTSDELAMIEHICEMAKTYRNRVLTVLCLPRACKRLKGLFRENMGMLSFVELREDLLTGERVAEALHRMTKEQGVRADKSLMETVSAERSYLPAELQQIFEEWYDAKLKSKVYPQYEGIATACQKSTQSKPRGTAYEELQEMIGLGEAKGVIDKALKYYKVQQLYAQKGVKASDPAMHMVFTGNPGTAKTTVARLFARIMRENGLLARGHLVEVGRGDLVGKYVGWTAQTVQAKFKQAQGGVLFIDEAYSLVDGRDGSYGDEAINTIVQEMENHRADMVVIFAGYPEQMEGFLQKNPGLRSRVAFHVPFADYNSEELCAITRLIGDKDGMKIEQGALEKLAALYERVRTQSDFGNGRYARNIFEQAKMNQASRLLEMDFDSITTEDVRTITADDIQLPELPKTEKRRVGFF